MTAFECCFRVRDDAHTKTPLFTSCGADPNQKRFDVSIKTGISLRRANFGHYQSFVERAMMSGCRSRRMRVGRCRLIIGSSSGAFNCVLLRGKNHGSNARSRNRVYHGHGCWVLPLLVQACSVGQETPSQRYKVVKAVQRVASVVPDHSFKKVYPWASDRLGETGGERPHKMKPPQTPFRAT